MPSLEQAVSQVALYASKIDTAVVAIAGSDISLKSAKEAALHRVAKVHIRRNDNIIN